MEEKFPIYSLRPVYSQLGVFDFVMVDYLLECYLTKLVSTDTHFDTLKFMTLAGSD